MALIFADFFCVYLRAQRKTNLLVKKKAAHKHIGSPLIIVL